MQKNNEQSLISRFIEAGLRKAGVKNKSLFSNYVNMLNKAMPARPLQYMFLKYDIDFDDRLEHAVWTIEPKKDLSDKFIIYLHGGSYMYNFLPPHWMFIGSLVDHLKATVIAPDYPLAPEYHAQDVFEMLLSIYTELIKKAGAENVTIMGDSAGGGMTLALAQLLAEKDIEQPEQLILLSPCVDVTLTNPEIQQVDKDDPMLNVEAILEAGKAYAGTLDRTHYLVSPIYGELKGLAPISVYVGTHDIMVADCRKLNGMAQTQGIPLTYHEYEGLLHVGMLYPTPEAEEIRETIIEDLEH